MSEGKTVVFGGFSAEAVRDRMNDPQATLGSLRAKSSEVTFGDTTWNREIVAAHVL